MPNYVDDFTLIAIDYQLIIERFHNRCMILDVMTPTYIYFLPMQVYNDVIEALKLANEDI